MSFMWPAAWLLILPLAAFLYWHPFRSRWVTGLRLALYLALVLALSGIVVEWPDRTGTLIVAVDRSRSAWTRLAHLPLPPRAAFRSTCAGFSALRRTIWPSPESTRRCRPRPGSSTH